MEIETQILISQRLGYMDSDQSNMLLNRATEVGKILNGLLSSLRQKQAVISDPLPYPLPAKKFPTSFFPASVNTLSG